MKLKFKTKFLYGLAGFGDSALYCLMFTFLLFFLTTVAGIEPAMAGFIVAIGSVWETLVSPVIGHISDNTVSRFGKRKPFMIFAAVPLGVCNALLFTYIDASYMFRVIYYGGMVVLFWSLFAVFFIPYLSWGAELTKDYNERTSVRSYTYVMNNVGMMLSMIVPTAFVDYFTSRGGSETSAWSLVGIIIGIASAAVILISAFGIKADGGTDLPKHRHRISALFLKNIFNEYMQLLKLRSLRYIVCASMLYLIANAVASSDRMYFFTYCMGYSGSKVTFLMLYITAVGIVLAPVIDRLAKKYDKKTVFTAVMILSAVATAMFRITGIDNIIVLCVFLLLYAVGSTAYWQLVPSMLYDVCEVDYLASGKERAGSVVSLQSIAESLSEAIGVQMLGIILQFAGFDGEAAIQSETASLWVENSFMILPAVFMLAAAYMIYRYPVSKEIYGKVVKALDDRNRGIEVDMKEFEKLIGRR